MRRASDSRAPRERACTRHCSPPSDQERLEIDPSAGRDEGSMRGAGRAGRSLWGDRIARGQDGRMSRTIHDETELWYTRVVLLIWMGPKRGLQQCPRHRLNGQMLLGTPSQDAR
ncbi:protein of unknown function [Hyphomicrobium sp. 1Nfss2.1]